MSIMDEMETRKPGAMRGIALLFNRLVYGVVDILADSLRTIAREKELFLGTGLALLGLLNFNVGRYCDGNTAEYLSCTRPAVYYYFDALDIALIIVGVFLVLVWFVRVRS